MERRYVFGGLAGVELRAQGEGDATREIRGHASVFNQEEVIFPGFREVILPGAFEKAIGRDDVRALWNHDSNIVLGRSTAGTLKLEEDKIGLAYSVDPPDTQLVRDMVISPIERGDVTGSSFGFRVETANEIPQDDGSLLREVVAAELIDVSPVTFPAYPDATVAMRGWISSKDEAGAGELLRAILDRDLTDEEIRSILNPVDEKRPKDEAPAGDSGGLISIMRARLDLGLSIFVASTRSPARTHERRSIRTDEPDLRVHFGSPHRGTK